MKIYLLFLLLLPIASAEFYINEVMYNPEGSDNNKEYIEIYTDLDLSNFTVEDLKSQDILEKVKSTNSNFALIVEEEFDYTDIAANIYNVGKTIGNNLNNDGDIIVIKDEDKILDVFSYTDKFGANNNGLSLCKIPDKTGPFKECPSSPGKNNERGETYNLEITEILPDPAGYDNALMPNGEWIEIHNLEEFEIDLAGFYIKDNFGRKLYISEANTISSTKITDYLVVYVNGFSGLLNNDGFESVNLYDQNNNLIDSMNYGNTQEGVSWSLIEDLWHKSNPTPEKENPQNKEDIEIDSWIDIDTIYLGTDNKAKWGDSLRIKLIIYKGNTSKESVQAWFFKDTKTVSKRTRLNVHERFKEQEYTIPIQINPNCKLKFKDGDYTLIVQGLNTETKEKIEISGLNSALCEQSKSKPKEFTYELVNSPQIISVGENFESTLKIYNNLNVKQKFLVWNQVKKGSKTISKKDKNAAIEVDIPPSGSANIKLDNLVVTGNGTYELKLNVLQENKKRPQILTTEVEIINTGAFQESETVLKEESENEITGNVVFQSKSKSQKKLALYFLMLVIGLIAIYSIFRK